MATAKAVLAGFVGIRRRADHEQSPLDPRAVALVAVVFVVLFVLALRTLVGMIAS